MSNSPYFYFESEKLIKLGEELHEEYINADPYPHIAIDDFLPEDIAQRALDEFPGPDDIEWQRYSADTESLKLACGNIEQFGPFLRHLMSQLNSAPVVLMLEKLTGIEGLIPDPYFRGGGLFQTLPGGVLDIHADFNKNAKLNLDRRVNLLIQLNKDWKHEYGGHLELWDKKMKRVKKVLPIFNRCTIFSPTSTTWHGHPRPLTCPEGETRKSLSAFYYTNGRPAKERKRTHSTIWKKIPDEEILIEQV